MNKPIPADRQGKSWMRKLIHCIVWVAIPAGLFYVVAALILKATCGFTIVQIIRDPAQQTEQSSFLGFTSNIGSWLWIAAASICFFSAGAGRAASRRLRELLILTGLLSWVLVIDDFFMIHDRYVNQNLCYLVYALVAGLLLVRHYRLIMQIEGMAFLMAGFLLAISILTDEIQCYLPYPYPYTQAVEEGFKFVGEGMWLYFACRISIFALRSNAQTSCERDQSPQQ